MLAFRLPAHVISSRQTIFTKMEKTVDKTPVLISLSGKRVHTYLRVVVSMFVTLLFFFFFETFLKSKVSSRYVSLVLPEKYNIYLAPTILKLFLIQIVWM